MDQLKKSSDNFPISLIYMDTSSNPHKLLGHIWLDKMSYKKNALFVQTGYNAVIKLLLNTSN